MAKLTKPAACVGCALADKGDGYVPGEGPPGAPIAFVAESAGVVEALTGRPLVGDAGGMFTRLLNLLGWSRDAFRLDNCCRCRPPNDWFDQRAPWFHAALAHCQYVEQETLSKGSKVVVALGGTALRRLMHLEHHKDIRVENFHGSILRDPTDRFWVVPTFHPSFLQRGATNLIGTVLWDLRQAEIARDTGRPADPGTLIIDPPLDWFTAWVDQVVAARTQDPRAYPVTSDVETPDKAGGKSEGELTTEDQSFQILRQNVTCHPDEGITVPEADGYRQQLARLYASPGDIWQWNREYDFIRQVRGGYFTEADSPRVVDLMWYAKVLQSDIPLGLGFWAPFYSTYGPWKHLASQEPAKYAAIDALQNHRIGFGLITDLLRMGQYQVARRHTHDLKTLVLRPAQLVGVKVDRQRLTIFKESLAQKARSSMGAIQLVVPESVCPLTPKGGLTKPPLDNVLHVKATAFTRKGLPRAGRQPTEIKQELYAHARVVEKVVLKEVWTCESCGAVDIPRRHQCARDQGLQPDPGGAGRDGGGGAQLVLAVASVSRWFWQEPFNPDSWQQVLAYIKAKKHRPGRNKKSKSGSESTDRETLLRLSRTTDDAFYRHLLDYRAVVKVKGTYVEGTERRLDADDRLHPVPTFRPSTMRLCVAKGTPIDVLRDVSEFPAGIPIEDVKVGAWAYTFNAGRELTLRRVTWVGQTGTKAVVRVHWAGSNKRPQRGYVDLTPEHGVRLVSGEYRPAGDLQPGDRVLSLARISDRGYIVLNATGHAQVREHRFVQRVLVGRAGDHVHHKNERTADNRDDNLENQTAVKHRRHHMVGAKNPRWRHDWPEQDPHLRRRRGYQEYRARRYNHRILHVEVLPDPVPVYDLEVQQTHNFIANEICVHNSYVDPNITNVVADKGGEEGLAAGFRRCIVADPAVPAWAAPVERAPGVMKGARLLEVDFSAIEAVQTGWCARFPLLMRIARLGIHSYLIAHRMKDPPDLRAADADIAAHLKTIKKKAGALLYDQVKHTVYGVLYGQTPIGLQYTWPHLYPTQKVAQEMVEFMFGHFPAVRVYQQTVMDTAARQHFLGGPDAYTFTPPALGVAGGVVGHPYQYKHWFWSIYTYKRLTRVQELRLLALAQKAGQAAPITYINGQPFRLGRGSDANRAIALYPQSIAAGNLKEVELRLFADHDSASYIGDAYFGRTPLRAPIHDSLLLEVPFRQWDRVAEKVGLEMQRPILEQPLPDAWGLGTHLTIGVAAKAGENWADTEDLSGTWGWTGAVEAEISPMEVEDEGDVEDLQRAV